MSDMWEEILKAISLVFLPSMLKFIFGPIGGKAAGLHLVTTMIGTAAGMMASVTAFTFFGEFLRAKILSRLTKKEKPEEEQRKNIFKKYGLAGIAIFTPIILTPIGGTILAVGFTPNRGKILLYMLISACAWSAIITAAVYFGYDAVVRLIKDIQPV